jgi:hypothetical protein
MRRILRTNARARVRRSNRPILSPQELLIDVWHCIIDFLELKDIHCFLCTNKWLYATFNHRLYRRAIDMSLQLKSYDTHTFNPVNSAVIRGYIPPMKKFIEMRFPVDYMFPTNPCVPVNSQPMNSGVGINTVTNPRIQWTILLTAIHMSNTEVVTMILDKGAEVNTKHKIDIDCDIQEIDRWGGLGLSAGFLTPLHVAMVHERFGYYWWCSMDELDMIQLLVERGAEINAVGPHGATPLAALAFNYINYGIREDYDDGSSGDLKARYLISRGGHLSPNLRVDSIWLTRSIRHFNPLMLKIIILLTDVVKAWPVGFWGLSAALTASAIHYSLVLFPRSGIRPVGTDRYIHQRIGIHRIQMLEMLVEAGFSPDEQDGDGNTPLHYAWEYCDCGWDRPWDNSTCFAAYLIKKGASYRIRNGNNETSLENESHATRSMGMSCTTMMKLRERENVTRRRNTFRRLRFKSN